jgi:hypothetical protein
MIDFVFAEIAIPEDGLGWKEHLHELGREAMVRFTQHPWVVMCMSRGTFSFGALQLMDHVLGVLHDAGFDDEESHHAWQLLASHTMGYAFQSSTGLGATNKDPSEFESQLTQIGRQFPNVARLAPQVIGCVWDTEFVFGLEIILDGLESRLG